MAWQLIYTSAPRLLEAGRSGFGTVARHRQISPLLVSACERASQFARLPGLDTGRLILSHRIVAAGGGRFHVLTCIRDAGADHTRRTNHLAHHLIAEEREIAQLRAPVPSPADILLAMPWVATWNEAPRWLDAADEIDLGRLARSSGGGAWAKLTGNAAHARLLLDVQSGNSAWLIAPGGTNVCALFAESLRLDPSRAWRVRFTTSLQPSDDAADFDWIGMEAGSPLRAQVEATGRLTLDLTTPATLPAIAASPAAPLPTPSAVVRSAAPPTAPPTPGEKQEANDPFQGYKPARALPRKTFAIAGAVVVVLVAAALTLPWLRGVQEGKRQRAEIVSALISTGLFDTAKTRAEFAAELDRLRPASLARARALAEASAALAQTLSRPDFNAIRRASVRTQLKDQADAIGMNLPVEISSLTMQLDNAATLEGKLQQFPATKAGDPEYDEIDRCSREIDSLGSGMSPEMMRAFGKVRESVQKLAMRRQAEALHALLSAPLRPSRDLPWFRMQEQKLRTSDEAPELKTVSNLLDDWSAVQNGTPDEVQKRSTLRGNEWPKWLLAEARKKAPIAPTADRVADAKPLPASTPIAANSGAPLYVVREIAGLKDFRIPELTAGLSYFFRPAFDGESIELLNPGGRGNLRRRDRVNSDPAFRVNEAERTITPEAGSSEFAPPFILFARNSAGAEVVRLWIVPPTSQPLLPKRRAGLTRDGDKLRVDAAALGLPGPFKNPLRIRLPDSWAIPGARPEPTEIRETIADLGTLRKLADDTQKKLRAEIAELQQSLDPKDAKPNARFQVQGAKVLDVAGLLVGKPLKEREAALRLREHSAPLFQQCGSYLLAVCAPAIFPRVEAVSKSGGELLELDPAASTKAQTDAIEKALANVRLAQSELRDAKTRERYSQTLRELETLIEMARPDTPDDTTRRLGTETQNKTRLAAAKEELRKVSTHPVFSAPLPAGVYRIAAVAEGAEVDLVEIEVAP